MRYVYYKYFSGYVNVNFPPAAAPLSRSLCVPGMFPEFLLQLLLKPYHLLPGQTAQSLFPPSSMKFYIDPIKPILNRLIF